MDSTNIFVGEQLRLSEINPKEDAEKESLWTHAIEYARMRKENPVRPMSAMEVRKDLEGKLKESDESGHSFHFAIRSKDGDGELLGFLNVVNIEWSNGQGVLQILFGTEELSKEHLPESIQMALRYAFDELNLYHICMEAPAYDTITIPILEKTGFSREACLREIIFHNGKYHDRIIFGILAEEWRQKKGLP